MCIRDSPTSPLALADCDGGGIDNLTECQNGDDPFDQIDDNMSCADAAGNAVDICAILAADPDNPIGLLDCDGGGVDNATECANGGDPSDPGDDCQIGAAAGVDICAFVLANPTSPMALADCDGGGISNLIECQNGDDPFDPSDDCNAAAASGTDICAFVLANPTSPLALADCDGGGIDNLTECQNGDDPFDPIDDNMSCADAAGNAVDICAILAADPDNPIGLLDCDGGGVDNATECANGGDPNLSLIHI